MNSDPDPTDVLVAVDALAARLRGERPPVLLDVRWNLAGPPGRPEYEAGHLPGAHWVDLEAELSGPVRDGAGGRHPLPDAAVLSAAMRRAGVSPGTDVVVYDARSSLAAARLWWLLLDAGHDRVQVLDGGFAAWAAAGEPVETGPDQPSEPGTFVARPGHLPRVDAAAVLAAGDGLELVDVRAAERYAGEVEPVDPVAGHIPGAVNRPSPGNQDADGRSCPPRRSRSASPTCPTRSSTAGQAPRRRRPCSPSGPPG